MKKQNVKILSLIGKKQQKNIMVDVVEMHPLLENRPNRTYGDDWVLSQPNFIEISECVNDCVDEVQGLENEVRLEEQRNQLAQVGCLDFAKWLVFCFIFKCNTSRLGGGKNIFLPSLCFSMQVKILSSYSKFYIY